MNQQVEPIQRIALQLSRLPGIGQKSALRLAYHIVSLPEDQEHDLAPALWEGRKAVHFCTRCGNYTEGELCGIPRTWPPWSVCAITGDYTMCWAVPFPR